jgi:hypothetical protein
MSPLVGGRFGSSAAATCCAIALDAPETSAVPAIAWSLKSYAGRHDIRLSCLFPPKCALTGTNLHIIYDARNVVHGNTFSLRNNIRAKLNVVMINYYE